MLLVEVNISKIAFFIAAQNFSQVVTKFITCDDVTRFDGAYLKVDIISNSNSSFNFFLS